VTALCRKVGSLKGERDALETALAEQKRSMKELEAERRVEVNRIVESFRHLGIHENPFEGLVGSGIEGCFE
jgi:cystathionine beta-lyase family protein involved in aluminum resistance